MTANRNAYGLGAPDNVAARSPRRATAARAARRVLLAALAVTLAAPAYLVTPPALNHAAAQATPGDLVGLLAAPKPGSEANALSVSWFAFTNATKYLVQHKTGAASYNTGTIVFAPNTNFDIGSLLASTTYDIRVTARNDADTDLAVATTQATTLGVLSGLTLKNKSGSESNTQIASWDAFAGATKYRVQHSPTNATLDAGTVVNAPTTSREIGSLQGATTYFLRVTARDASDNDLAVGTASAQTLWAPGLTAVPKPGSETKTLSVSWAAFGDATKYRVQHKTGAASYNIGTIVSAPDTNLDIGSLLASTTYDIKVTARDDANTDLGVATTQGTTLGVLSGLTFKNKIGSETNTQIASWDAFAGATKYLVQHHHTDPTLDTGRVVNAPTTSREISGLQSIVTYNLRVTARDASDNDLAIGTASAQTLRPLRGLSVRRKAGSPTDTISVSWTAHGGATKYQVRHKARSDTAYNTGTTVVAPNTSLDIDGLTEDTTYDVSVVARNASTVDLAAATSSATTLGSLPTFSGLTATPPSNALTSQLLVVWPVYSGATVRYRVEFRTGDAAFAVASTQSAQPVNNSYFIRNLMASTTYDVKVFALDSSGRELAVATAQGTTQGVVAGLTVTPKPRSEANTLSVSWTALAGATKYLVQHKTGSAAFGAGTTVTAPTTTLDIESLMASTTYSVRVTAQNDANTTLARATVSASTLGAVVGISAVATGRRRSTLAVSWTAYTGAASYQVQHRTGTAAFNTGINAAFLTAEIDSLMAGTLYDVKVTALDVHHNVLGVGYTQGTTLGRVGNLTVTPDDNLLTRLHVSWNAVPSASKYAISWKKTGATVSIGAIVTTGTTAMIDNLEAGTEYTVSVQAIHGINGVDISGLVVNKNGSTAGNVIVTVPAPQLANPTSTLVVQWSTVTSATKYSVHYRLASDNIDAAYTLNAADVTKTSNTITGLQAATFYDVRVTALDDSDNKLAVGSSLATTYSTFTRVTAAAVSGSTDKIDVSWDAPIGADAYQVEWQLAPASDWFRPNRSGIITTGTTYQIPSLTPGEHDVRVVPRYDHGGLTKLWGYGSHLVARRRTCAGIGTVTISAVTVARGTRDDMLDVSWTAPTGHPNAVAYRVQWRKTSDSEYHEYNSALLEPASFGQAPPMSYRIDRLDASTPYTVRVTSIGSGAVYPATVDCISKEATATTAAPLARVKIGLEVPHWVFQQRGRLPIRHNMNWLREGEISHYTLVLTTQPSSDVVVTATSESPNTIALLGPASFTFTTENWDTPQRVQLYVPGDDIVSPPTGAKITHTVTGYSTEGVTTAPFVFVAYYDDDAAATYGSPLSLTVPENDAATYSVWLKGAPAENKQVVVKPVSSDPSVATVPNITMTFTGPHDRTVNCNTDIAQAERHPDCRSGEATRTVRDPGNYFNPQLMFVNGVDNNAVDDPARATTITHSITCVTIPGTTSTTATCPHERWFVSKPVISVTLTDDEATPAPPLELVVTPTAVEVDEGSSGAYTVKLSRQPESNTRVHVLRAGAETDNPTTTSVLSTAPEILTFSQSNWNTAQTVTVTAINDAFYGDRTVVLKHSYGTDVFGPDVTVTIDSEDTKSVRVSSAITIAPTTPLSVHESDNPTTTAAKENEATFTVKLNQSPPRSRRPPFTTQAAVLTMGTSDAEAVSVAPGRLTFTGGNWSTPQTVTVTAVDNDVDDPSGRAAAAIVYDLRSVIQGTIPVDVADDDPAELPSISLAPASAAAPALVANWGAATGAASYEVQIRLGDDDYTDAVSVGNLLTQSFTNLTGGATYTVRVTAKNSGGTVIAQSAATATAPHGLGAVTLTRNPATDTLSVSWDAVADATGYVLQWKGPGESYLDTGTVRRRALGAVATDYIITGLTASTSYDVRVTAQHTVNGTAIGTSQATASESTPGTFTGTVEPLANTTDTLQLIYSKPPPTSGVDSYVISIRNAYTDGPYHIVDRRDKDDNALFTFSSGDTSEAGHVIQLLTGGLYTMRVHSVEEVAGAADRVLAVYEGTSAVAGSFEGGLRAAGDLERRDTLTVAWNFIPGAAGYRVQWKKYIADCGDSPKPACDTFDAMRQTDLARSVNSHRIEKLEPSTAYEVKVTVLVRASENRIVPGASDDKKVSTAQELKGLVVQRVGTSPTAIQPGKLHVEWSAVTDPTLTDDIPRLRVLRCHVAETGRHRSQRDKPLNHWGVDP